MGKQKKSFKNFKKNTKFQKKHIKGQKIAQAKKREDQIKNQKLVEENLSSDEDEKQPLAQQEYLNKKKKNSELDNQEQLTSEEVKKFLDSMKEEDDDDENLVPEDVIHLVEQEEDPDLLEEGEGEELDQNEQQEEGEEDQNEEEIGEDQEGDDEKTNEEGDLETSELEEGDDEKLENGYIDEEGDIIEGEESTPTDKIELTKEIINDWIQNVRQKKDLLHAKKLIFAFFLATHMNDKELRDKDKEIMDKSPWVIKSHSVYLRILLGATKFVIMAYNHHFKIDSKKPTIPDSKSSKFKHHRKFLSLYLSCLKHLLSSLNDPETLSYILGYIYEGLHLTANFEKGSRKLLGCFLNLLGNENEDVRFKGFLCIHKMATVYPHPFMGLCFKGIYFTFVQNSNDYNPRNFEIIDFIMNCIVEIYGLDFSLAYQQAFVYIRQLAITLRKGLEKEKLAWTLCYNWKFINSLQCWTKVVCTYSNREELKELIYPLVQIITGTCSISSNPRFFSAKFKLISMLNNISISTGMFIPVGGLLLDIIGNHDEILELPKGSNPSLDFIFHLKCKEKDKKTREFQIMIFQESIYYLIEFLSLHSTSIAFPEISYPVYKFFRKMVKDNPKNIRASIKSKIVDLMKKIDENSKFIFDKRSNVTFTPKDFDKIKEFLPKETKTPLSQFYENEREKRSQNIIEKIESMVKSKAITSIDEELNEEENEKKEKQTVQGPEEKPKKEKRKRQVKETKSKKIKSTGLEDEVEDIDLNNF